MPSKLPSTGRRKPVTARLERANPGARAARRASNVGVLMSATLQATDLAAATATAPCSAH